MFLFYVLSFFRKGDTIQGGPYFRKYGSLLNLLLLMQESEKKFRPLNKKKNSITQLTLSKKYLSKLTWGSMSHWRIATYTRRRSHWRSPIWKFHDNTKSSLKRHSTKHVSTNIVEDEHKKASFGLVWFDTQNKRHLSTLTQRTLLLLCSTSKQGSMYYGHID